MLRKLIFLFAVFFIFIALGTNIALCDDEKEKKVIKSSLLIKNRSALENKIKYYNINYSIPLYGNRFNEKNIWREDLNENKAPSDFYMELLKDENWNDFFVVKIEEKIPEQTPGRKYFIPKIIYLDKKPGKNKLVMIKIKSSILIADKEEREMIVDDLKEIRNRIGYENISTEYYKRNTVFRFPVLRNDKNIFECLSGLEQSIYILENSNNFLIEKTKKMIDATLAEGLVLLGSVADALSCENKIESNNELLWGELSSEISYMIFNIILLNDKFYEKESFSAKVLKCMDELFKYMENE